MIFKDKISSKSDVFSFGVVLFEIFSKGENPWSGFGNAQVINSLKDGTTMPLPKDFGPESIIQIIHKCWKINPHERPTFKVFKNYFLFFF